MSDCGMHFPFEPTADLPYQTVRCSHLESRFVVEIVNRFSGYRMIDYVEKLASGELLVESNDVVPGQQPERVVAIWNGLVERMERGDPPRPEV